MGSASDPLPPADAVRAELDRILTSDGFTNAGRLSRLLRFVVERTIDGRADEIKEYVLGVEVFDRGADYDPRLDSIVRVEARRLRTKLDEFYALNPAPSGVAIRLKRGSYVPLFETTMPAAALPAEMPAPSAGAGRGRAMWMAIVAVMIGVLAVGIHIVRSATPVQAGALPRVAVLPFAHYPADAGTAALADHIADGITTELVRRGRFEIVSRMSTRQFVAEPRPAGVVAQSLGAAWLVEARVHREGGEVRVDVRLVDAARDRKVWAEDFSRRTDDLRALARDAASAIDSALQSALASR